ncbi:MarR family transcriptional regulator [Halomarina rubra]|uniref:MarR family transcriptional regulator n=1 Tax=Halomarina rubra TaxID=2071873 RepID=A0ABD6ASB3_9EURY|nr:MarR family winged helix-turn-helix transcriptional regulator [Halomarina rubra]
MSDLTARNESDSWLTIGLETTADVVAQLPPSAKLVLSYLRDNGPCSRAETEDDLCLPTSTTKHALTELKDEDLVEDRPSMEDGRVTVYNIVAGVAEDVESPTVA